MRTTNDFLKILKSLQPDFDSIVEQGILAPYPHLHPYHDKDEDEDKESKEEEDKEAERVGWHCYAYLKDGDCFGGGTHQSKETARRIVIAESLERSVFYHLCREFNEKKKGEDPLCLKSHPTTCGFAVGFQDEPTRWRALCEGLERWAWSKWIDDHFFIPRVTVPSSFSRLSEALKSPFEDIQCYQKKMFLLIGGKRLFFNFNVFLGFKDKGVFPGSRVVPEHEEQWDHCVIEAWRNWNNFKIYHREESSPSHTNSIVERIIYFGKHAQEACKAIACAKENRWPEPQIRLFKKIPLWDEDKDSFFVWRCLMKDYFPWDKGSKERFVY